MAGPEHYPQILGTWYTADGFEARVTTGWESDVAE